MKVRVTNVLSRVGEVSQKEIQHISSGYEFYLFQSDAIINLPNGISEVKFGDVIAIDTETMGLNINRDRLCLIQLSSGDGNAHLVQISKKSLEKENNFTNLRNIFKILY